MKKNDYRKDNRTLQEFKEDIKKYSEEQERGLHLVFKALNIDLGDEDYTDNGVDNSGEYIEDDEEIHCDADFCLNKKIEVKLCNPNINRFHIKVNQVKTYIKENAVILFIMGYDTDNPHFTFLNPKDVLDNYVDIVDLFEKRHFELKKTDFRWFYINDYF